MTVRSYESIRLSCWFHGLYVYPACCEIAGEAGYAKMINFPNFDKSNLFISWPEIGFGTIDIISPVKVECASKYFTCVINSIKHLKRKYQQYGICYRNKNGIYIR